jgi:hypothetical protein
VENPRVFKVLPKHKAHKGRNVLNYLGLSFAGWIAEERDVSLAREAAQGGIPTLACEQIVSMVSLGTFVCDAMRRPFPWSYDDYTFVPSCPSVSTDFGYPTYASVVYGSSRVREAAP